MAAKRFSTGCHPATNFRIQISQTVLMTLRRLSARRQIVSESLLMSALKALKAGLRPGILHFEIAS